MADRNAGPDSREESPEGESEWRFPLSEFEDDGADGDGATAEGDRADAVAADSHAGAGDADGEPRDRDADEGSDPTTRERIEAGDPTLEGTVFLLLGVGFALFVIARLVVG